MSCCGARNPPLAVRSQDFDRCHSFLLAASAPGGARKRPRFGNPPCMLTPSREVTTICNCLRSLVHGAAPSCPVAVPEIFCSLTARMISTAATPFCSLHPPPAALANVPASVTLQIYLYAIVRASGKRPEALLIFVSYFAAFFARSQSVVKAAGSWIAVSESILRFMSRPASFRPCINVE